MQPRMRLLIDAPNVAWRAAFRLEGMKNQETGAPTGAIFGFLRTLEFLAREIQPEEMIVCWDRACPSRREIYPEYKANRRQALVAKALAGDAKAQADLDYRQDVEWQMGQIKRILHHLFPVVQVEEDGAEADDVIGVLSKFMGVENVGIVTTDKDLYQLADPPRCEIIGTDGEPVPLEFKPRQYLTYKMLAGDPSDNIKGVEGVGDITIRKLLREHGTLKRIMRAAKEAGKMGRMAYKDALEIVRRNKQLMIPGLLLTEPQRIRILNQYRNGRVDRALADKNEVRKAFRHYKFTSLVSRLSSFTMQFHSQIRQGSTYARKRKWHPPQPYTLREKDPARAVRAADTTPRYCRIIRRTLPRQPDHPSSGGRGFTRIIRRTVKPTGQGAKATLLADAGRATRGGSARARSRNRRSKTKKVGKSGAGGDDAARVPPQATAAERAEDTASAAEQDRRFVMLMRLQAMGQDSAWPEKQSKKTLTFVDKVIRTFQRDPLHVPSTQDAAWVAEMYEDWAWAAPGWMGPGLESAPEGS